MCVTSALIAWPAKFESASVSKPFKLLTFLVFFMALSND